MDRRAVIKLNQEQELTLIYRGISDSDMQHRWGLIECSDTITLEEFQRGIRCAYAVTDQKLASQFVLEFC